MQIMYGAAGERRLDEWEIDWLPGYEGSAPVRIGNAAAGQFQLDVYGEVMSALYESAPNAGTGENPAWEFQLALMDFVRDGWREPDDGIWEVRGPRRHFTHSKVMAWVAVDRAIKTADKCTLDGPIREWKKIRQEIHDQVCDQGFNAEKGSFTQYYGSDQLDASLLMIPLVDFLPAHDPRVRGTIEAVERELVEGGFVLRYRTVDTGDVDGLTGREGAFLACSFWLADCLSMLGRDRDARQLLDRLMGLRNDLGLLSEEYDPVAGRLVGNFPQAFSHVSLINSASKLAGHDKPTSEHVMVGLARRALTRPVRTGKGPAALQAGGFNASRMLASLAESLDTEPAGSAAGAIKAATGTLAARVGQGRGKPTTKPTDKRASTVSPNAPAQAVAAAEGASGPPATRSKSTKKSTKKKATATRSTSATTRGKKAGVARKVPATKRAGARATKASAAPKAAPAKAAPAKAAAKKQPAKKRPAKKQAAKKRATGTGRS
jgi:hypothetical protein